MNAVLASLSYEHRRVLTELYYNDRTYTEAAVSLGVPAGTVKSRKHYALCELRRAFEFEHSQVLEPRSARRAAIRDQRDLVRDPLAADRLARS